MRIAITARTLARLLWLTSLLSLPALAAPADDGSWIADKNGCKIANPFPRPGETATWSGECKEGFAQGEGVLQFFLDGQADDRYEGSMEMGWAEGHGVLYKLNGGKYEGDWKHSAEDGMGRYEAPDGSWYEGQWKMGKPHGQGQYRRSDGKLFVGEWVNGVYEGDAPPHEEDSYDPNRI